MESTVQGAFLAPVESECVLFCQHADVSEFHIDISAKACADQPFHWFYVRGENNGKAVCKRNDGEEIRFNWVAICSACERELKATKADVMDFAGRDAPWIGEPPNITRVV